MDPPERRQDEDFRTTRWSLVVAAAGEGTAEADRALATLCETYWYPLYAYARRRGADPAVAQDRTQSYFATLLEKNYVRDADRERGRFRTFLLTSFRNHMAKAHDRATAAKRGGGRAPLSLDFTTAERRYRLEPADPQTPEHIFERRWALTLIEDALERVRRQYGDAGKAELFEALEDSLAGEPPDRSLAEIARALGMTAGAVKVAAHRLRRRFRDALRAAIAKTVTDPASIDDELRHLMRAVST